MDKALDLGFVFKSHETKHKIKPSQFLSVAGGVQKRRETNIKHRKSCRLTEFDNVRDLSASETPKKPVNEAELKIEHRRQQLEKWKEEKEMKKKQQAMQKKKPFVAGVVPAPLKFVLPPPPRPMPSSSGRVTRSQSAKAQNAKKEIKPVQSFAPKSSNTFKPPQLKCALPVFPSSKTRQKPSAKISIMFEPVVPKKNTTVEPEKRTRSTRATRTNTNDKAKVKSKPSPKKAKKTKVMESIPEPSPISHIVPIPKAIPAQEKPKKRASRKSSTQKFIIEDLQPEPPTQRTMTPILSKLRHSQESVILPTRKTPKRASIVEKNNNTPKDIKNPVSRTPKHKLVPKSESTSEEKLRSPIRDPLEGSLSIDKPRTPEQIIEEAKKKSSPCVTMSRGKDNARREMKKKLVEGLLDEDSSDVASVEHFRRQMESEVHRMTLMADEWDEIQKQTVLPEFVVELILTAVGQARLLMSQKIRQFAGLVARCAARDTAAGLVTPADLAGFWDMLFIQIENIDVRFKQLEALRARNWSEEQPRVVKKKVAKVTRAGQTKPTGQSRIRDMIAAARKAKKDQGTSSISSSPISISSTQTESTVEEGKPSSESKTFEAGFFYVKSPIRSPLPKTPVRNQSLLKCVLSSEARKASSSKNSPASFAMLRASLKGKHLEIEGISPLEQTPKQLPAINLDATPARSILKSAQKKKPAKKSVKTVLFDQSDNELSAKSPKELVLLDTTPIKDKEAADSGVSMDVDSDNKENKRRLTRQEAVDYSPVMTRLRRKSLQTPIGDKIHDKLEDKTPLLNDKVGGKIPDKKVLKDVENTPRRSSRRKSVGNDLIDLSTPKEQPRRGRRARKADV